MIAHKMMLNLNNVKSMSKISIPVLINLFYTCCSQIELRTNDKQKQFSNRIELSSYHAVYYNNNNYVCFKLKTIGNGYF